MYTYYNKMVANQKGVMYLLLMDEVAKYEYQLEFMV